MFKMKMIESSIFDKVINKNNIVLTIKIGDRPIH